jgi:hypothetical protein
VGVLTDFEITCLMRVFGSAPDAQASIRAWRFEPLPEIRTVRLNCRSAIMKFAKFRSLVGK